MTKINILAGLTCFGLSSFASAALISPIVGADPDDSVGVTGGTKDTGTWGVGHFVDGTGLLSTLSPSAEHSPSTSSIAGRATGTGGTATFDISLGGTFTLDGLALWNSNEDDNRTGKTIAERDKTTRGVASADFFYSTDNGANFTSWATGVTFTQESFDDGGFAPGDVEPTHVAVGNVSAQVKTFSEVAGITDIRMTATSHGDGIIAINEIAFNQVPEPSTSLLGALGLGLLFARRKR